MDALRGAIGTVVAFLPALVAGLVVLAIGWVVAMLASRLIRAVLPRLGFDRFLARHELTGRPPETRPGSNVVASATAWVIMLVALMQASNIWGLSIVAVGLAAAIAYLPNIVAAVLIFGAAFVAGNWVRDRLASSPAEMQGSSMLPGASRAGILTLGAFVALRQLLIAPEILVIAFSLVFGAIAVASALAFGLGGRRAAERMCQEWYERQRARRRLARTLSGSGVPRTELPRSEPSIDVNEPSGRPGIH